MSPSLRSARPEDAAAVAALVHASFLAHVAPDWEPAACDSLLADTTADKLRERINQAAVAVVHEAGGELRGVILLPRPSLVQLCFVAPGHLDQGIGRALWEETRRQLTARFPDVRTVELNASPYAVPAYRAWGFHPISAPYHREGAVATRMACWLPGRALGAEAVGPQVRVGVGVIVQRGGRVLLGQRQGAHGAGTWALPGGHLEFGETVEACACREALEETGLAVEVVARGPWVNDVMQQEARHYVTVFVLAQASTGEPRVMEPHKCTQWAWFDWAALPQPLFQPLQSLLDQGFRPKHGG